MPTTFDETQTVKELIDNFFADLSDKNRNAIEQYVELEKVLVEQYQRYINDELSSNNEVLQNFTKMMMGCCMQVLTFERDSRSRFLELQLSLADTHLKFLDMVKGSVSRTWHNGPTGESLDDDGKA
jgi:hypothetical protein